MQININIEDYLSTNEGQEIAKQALIEAFNNQAKQYFYSNPAAISNLARYVVEHVIGLSAEDLKSQLEAEVMDKISNGKATEYLNQNYVVKATVENCVREHSDVIRNQVINKLNESEFYDNLQWSIGDAVIKAIKGE